MNYSELVQAAKDWLEIDETTFNNNIDLMIGNAEKRIYRDVEGLPVQKKLVTGSATLGNKYLGMPSDLMSLYSMSVIASSIYYPLLKKDESFIYASYPTTTTGRPKYYAILDQTSFILGPTPDQAYTMEMHYYFQPNSIVVDSTTWLGTYAPQALLYAVLLEGYIFMKGDADLLNTFKAGFDAGVVELKTLIQRQKSDAYRAGDI